MPLEMLYLFHMNFLVEIIIYIAIVFDIIAKIVRNG